MFAGTVPPLLTVGVIAERLGVPVHRITYVIESRSIRPAGRAGNAKVFTEADVQHIAGELRRIAEEREGLSG
jgi:DNA-binding transcriptional MerR regulator